MNFLMIVTNLNNYFHWSNKLKNILNDKNKTNPILKYYENKNYSYIFGYFNVIN